MKSKPKRSTLENKLDALWRSYEKEGATCAICDSLPVDERVFYNKLDPHHIIGRGHRATRWDLKNRIWVCSVHHVFGKPMQRVQDNLGGWFINWDFEGDWMGVHRPEDKEHLRKLVNVTKHWQKYELEELIENFGKEL